MNVGSGTRLWKRGVHGRGSRAEAGILESKKGISRAPAQHWMNSLKRLWDLCGERMGGLASISWLTAHDIIGLEGRLARTWFHSCAVLALYCDSPFNRRRRHVAAMMMCPTGGKKIESLEDSTAY
jgi:hypothetical protein